MTFFSALFPAALGADQKVYPEGTPGRLDAAERPRSRWRSIVRDLQVPPETKLQRIVDKNPAHPFKQIGPKVYELSIRYNHFYVAVVLFIIFFIIMVVWTCDGNFANKFYPMPYIGMVACATAIYDFKDMRRYHIDGDLLEYKFFHNEKLLVVGSFHNIYVRLKRELQSGSTKKHYHLVLNGYMIDSRRISGTTTNRAELRRIGQKIAENLNLNYFDEANASPHHVIRHCPASRAPVFVYPESTSGPVHPILKGNDAAPSAADVQAGKVGPGGKAGGSALRVVSQTRVLEEGE